MLLSNKDLVVRAIKLADIGFISALYFTFGIICAKLFDYMYGKFDEEKENKKTLFMRFLEICAMIWLTGVVSYLTRNFAELIPSPFDGIYGFSHVLVKELKTAGVFTFVFLFFQAHLKEKIVSFYNKVPL